MTKAQFDAYVPPRVPPFPPSLTCLQHGAGRQGSHLGGHPSQDDCEGFIRLVLCASKGRDGACTDRGVRCQLFHNDGVLTYMTQRIQAQGRRAVRSIESEDDEVAA